MKNWAGNLTYSAERHVAPSSMEELQAVVAGADLLRPAGTRHSFNAIGDTTGTLVSLARMPRVLDVDSTAGRVTVSAGTTYADLCPPLHAAGFALENMPSLPHITVGGACATGTHGSGDRSGVLASAVTSLDLVLADGSIARVGEGSEVPLHAAAVSLGALGIVTALTLRVEPAYDIRQDVFEHLPAAAFADAFVAATELADSASFFTTWRDHTIDQVWLKRRIPGAGERALGSDFFGGTAATVDLHPIPGMDAANCTPQRGIPGPWHERLPHFRAAHLPSSGDELQTEYFVPRSEIGNAFGAVMAMNDLLAPLVQVSEIRSIAADALWLSPASGRATASIHFTWIPDGSRVAAALPLVEHALAPFDARAHWAKLSTGEVGRLRQQYPHLGEFAALARRLDPTGKLRNDYLDRVLAA